MSSIASREGNVLTTLDWTVVAIARMEKHRSAESKGRLVRFLRQYLRLSPGPRLASERLEALRLFCVRAWHCHVVRGPDMRALIEAGYTRSDAMELLTHITRCRGTAPAIEEHVI